MNKLSIQVFTGKDMFRSRNMGESSFIPQVGWSLKIPKTWEDNPDSNSGIKMTSKDEDGNVVELVIVKNITYHASRDFFQVDCCTLESEEQYEEIFGGNNEGELNWWRSKLFEILDIVPTSDYTHLLEKNDWWKKVKMEYERRERL